MALHSQELLELERLIVAPVSARPGERTAIDRNTLPAEGHDPRVAYRLIHDELMLDGNARQNVATFRSINASGHKYGLVYPGVGWVIWRTPEDLPEDLVFHVNDLGGDMPTFALSFSRLGGQVIGQYYNFLQSLPERLPADPDHTASFRH